MFKLFKSFNKKDWLIVGISIILIFAQVWLELKMPDYMSEITILVQTEGSKMSDILSNGGYMLLCAFGSMVGAIIVSYFISKLSANFSKNTRKSLFDKVETLSMNEVKGFSTNSLITRTTNDVTQVEMFIGMGLQLLFKAPITAVWAITKILNKYGIIFVCEKALPGTKVRGCFKVKLNTPAIYITDNYSGKDSFFFEIFHELGHCKSDYNEAKSKVIVDANEEQEKRADEFALDMMIDKMAWKEIEIDYCENNLLKISNKYKIPMSFFVGRLAKLRKITYSSELYNKYKLQ